MCFFWFSLDIFESMRSGTRWWKIVGTPVEVQVVGSLSHYLQTSWLYYALLWIGQVNGASTPKATSNLGCVFFWCSLDIFESMCSGTRWWKIVGTCWYASWGTGSLSHYLQTSWLYFGLVRSTAPPLPRQRRTWDVFFFGFRWTYLNQCAPALVDGR